MSDRVTFYHNPMSRGRIVHWMLEEAGAAYDVKLLDFEKREHKTPEFLAVNPMGKIPTIVHRGVVVTETPAILAYLADAFPGAGLAPRSDDPARGPYFRWLFFGASCIEPALIDRMLSRPVEKEGRRLRRFADQLRHDDQSARAAPAVYAIRRALHGAAGVQAPPQLGPETYRHPRRPRLCSGRFRGPRHARASRAYWPCLRRGASK